LKLVTEMFDKMGLEDEDVIPEKPKGEQ